MDCIIDIETISAISQKPKPDKKQNDATQSTLAHGRWPEYCYEHTHTKLMEK